MTKKEDYELVAELSFLLTGAKIAEEPDEEEESDEAGGDDSPDSTQAMSFSRFAELLVMAKPLPVAEVSAVLVAYRAGRAALGRLLAEHRGLAHWYANRYRNKGIDVEELVSEGLDGIAYAVYRFDLSRNLAFSTYTSTWVRHRVRRTVTDLGRVIRVPDHLHILRYNVAVLRREAKVDLTDGEVAERVGVSLEKLRTIERTLIPVASLDKPLMNADGIENSTMGDLIACGRPNVLETMEKDENERRFHELLTTLSTRERYVLLDRYKGATLNEVGRSLELSRERIRQIADKAIDQLRQRVQNDERTAEQRPARHATACAGKSGVRKRKVVRSIRINPSGRTETERGHAEKVVEETCSSPCPPMLLAPEPVSEPISSLESEQVSEPEPMNGPETHVEPSERLGFTESEYMRVSRGYRHLYVPNGPGPKLLEAFVFCGINEAQARRLLLAHPDLVRIPLQRMVEIMCTVLSARIDPLEHPSLMLAPHDLIKGRIRILRARGIVPTARLLNAGHGKWQRMFGVTKEKVIMEGTR